MQADSLFIPSEPKRGHPSSTQPGQLLLATKFGETTSAHRQGASQTSSAMALLTHTSPKGFLPVVPRTTGGTSFKAELHEHVKFGPKLPPRHVHSMQSPHTAVEGQCIVQQGVNLWLEVSTLKKVTSAQASHASSGSKCFWAQRLWPGVDQFFSIWNQGPHFSSTG